MKIGLKASAKLLTLSALILSFANLSSSLQNVFNKKGPAIPDFYPGIFNKQNPVIKDFVSHEYFWEPENPEDDYIFNSFDDDSISRVGSAVVQTEYGIIHGSTYEKSHAFFSVPYAVPPVNDLRFEPPELPSKEVSKVVNASVPNYLACQQRLQAQCDNGACISIDTIDEDCLVLNIFVPSSINLVNETEPPQGTLPVMVYFHGGYFYFGAGTVPLYSGKELSNHTNTIVVTVNYRLGPFGFLYYDDGEDTINGNQGLQDQRLALQWVHENIEKFGGNKSMVTIFGESAGAQSVMFHLISSESAPLFRRAIMQSNPASIQYNMKDNARLVTESLMDAVNCTDHTIKCLRSVTAESLSDALPLVILAALQRNSTDDFTEPFRPLIDGEEFQDQPFIHFDQGLWSTDKEVMLGVTAEEMAYTERFNLTESNFRMINDLFFGSSSDSITEEYIGLAENTVYDGNFSAIAAVEGTDAFFVCPTRALASFISGTSESGKVYLYNFTHSMSGPSCDAVLELDFLCGRAFHTSELVFVFRSGSEYGYEFSGEDVAMADVISLYWKNFAYFGSPDSDEQWLEYESTGLNHPNLILRPSNSEISNDYRNSVCDFWDSTNVYPSPGIPEESGDETTTTPSHTENTTSGVGLPGLQLLCSYFVILSSLSLLF